MSWRKSEYTYCDALMVSLFNNSEYVWRKMIILEVLKLSISFSYTDSVMSDSSITIDWNEY